MHMRKAAAENVRDSKPPLIAIYSYYLRRILLSMQANRAPALPNDCLAQEIQFDPQMDGFAYYLASRATGSKGSKIPAPTRYFIAVAHLRSNAKQQT